MCVYIAQLRTTWSTHQNELSKTSKGGKKYRGYNLRHHGRSKIILKCFSQHLYKPLKFYRWEWEEGARTPRSKPTVISITLNGFITNPPHILQDIFLIGDDHHHHAFSKAADAFSRIEESQFNGHATKNYIATVGVVSPKRGSNCIKSHPPIGHGLFDTVTTWTCTRVHI